MWYGHVIWSTFVSIWLIFFLLNRSKKKLMEKKKIWRKCSLNFKFKILFKKKRCRYMHKLFLVAGHSPLKSQLRKSFSFMSLKPICWHSEHWMSLCVCVCVCVYIYIYIYITFFFSLDRMFWSIVWPGLSILIQSVFYGWVMNEIFQAQNSS